MDATPHKRRSLAVLVLGSLGACLLALVVSGLLIVIGALAVILRLGGYLNFLRAQTRRERERHEHRRSSRSTQPPVRS